MTESRASSQSTPVPRETGPFTVLFRAHAPYVVNSLRRLGVREADLEDVAHEVFLVVHRVWVTFDASRPIRPWLFGIAFRVASDYRRLAYVARERATDAETIDALDVRRASGPDGAAEQSETRARILRALEAVSLERRAVLVLHDIDESTMPEIASALSIPLNTAYSRLRVARDEFRRAFRAISERTVQSQEGP